MVASFTGKGYGSGISKIILECVNQNNWFNPANPQCFIGLLFYIVMIYFFAYFYTSISFNPMEVAANLKKAGDVFQDSGQENQQKSIFPK